MRTGFTGGLADLVDTTEADDDVRRTARRRQPEWRREAQYRVDCLRGRAGARPWQWKGIM
jgi:hypothetical protein